MKSSSRLTSDQIKQLIADIENNPDKEITDPFFATLDAYIGLIKSLRHEEIGSRYPFVTTDLVSILQEPNLSSEFSVADKLAESFLNFITEPPENASQWAMQQLKKQVRSDTVAVPEYHLSKSHCISAILQYPQKYFEMQSDEVLRNLSLLKLPEPIANALASEIIKRKLPLSPMLINLIDLPKASPEIIFFAFDIFIESPTIDYANSIMSAFFSNPPLHFVCVSKAVKKLNEKGKVALQMLGSIISQASSFPFPFFYFYHPSVKPFVDEVEQILLHPNDEINRDMILQSLRLIEKKNLYFLVPLLLELKEFSELIHSISEEYYLIIAPYMEIVSE